MNIKSKSTDPMHQKRRKGKGDIKRTLEEIIGGGSSREVAKATTMEEIAQRIEELSKREQ